MLARVAARPTRARPVRWKDVSMFATLRQRDFTLLWLGGLIPLTGDWMLDIALPVYVYTVTHSAFATSLMAIAAFVPQPLLGSLTGPAATQLPAPLGIAPVVAVILALFVLMGVPGAATQAALVTLIQSVAPNRLLGRVMGLLMGLMSLVALLGMGIAGVFGDRVGPVPLLNVQGSAYVLAGMIALARLAAPLGARPPPARRVCPALRGRRWQHRTCGKMRGLAWPRLRHTDACCARRNLVPVLRPMTEPEYQRYNTVMWEDYARERARNLGTSIEHERGVAASQRQALQAQGMRAPGHHYWHVVDDTGAVVGSLWVHAEPGTNRAFIYDIVIHADQRGKGLGKATLELLDAWARGEGIQRIALNVFGDNAIAQALYRKQGYQVDTIQMSKQL
jgi:ribosomal protein S18 acetylase RimI-like enzyme